MRGADYLHLAATSLLEKRGRAIGAILGVTVAVVALGMALGIGESFQRAFVEQLQRTIAANSVIVTGGAAGLTDADIAYYRSIVGVRGAYGISITQGTVYTENGEQIVQLVAVDPAVLPEYLGVSDMDKALEEGEAEPRGLGVLVSYDLWRDPSTGRKKLEIGSTLTLRIRGKSIQLFAIGLLKQTGSSIMGQGFSTPTIFVDPETYHSYISTSRNYAAALILVEDLSQLDRVVDEVKALSPLGSRVIAAAAMVSQFVSMVGALQLFIALISAVGIGVTALWIFDSTAISVVQRTKEIGILKAIGFTGSDVLLLFVLESAVLSLIGIAAGSLLSYALSLYARISAFGLELRPLLTPSVLLISTLLPLVANALAAYIPARRAAALHPVEALRYE
uniref:ABC transporter permease n=1 Tax=Thermofilum pendens TaxID=2269 RepID=A0A7J3X7D1_THEPE